MLARTEQPETVDHACQIHTLSGLAAKLFEGHLIKTASRREFPN